MTEDTNFSSSYTAVCVLSLSSFLSCTAIMLNSLTIHAIRKTSSLLKPLKTLLISLAVSDLGVGLLIQPLGIARFVLEMEPNAESNPTYIKMKESAFRVPANLFYYATFFGVTALAVDRFLAVHLHPRYQEPVTKKRACAVAISIWILSAFLSLFPLWIPQIKSTSVIYGTIELVCLLTTALLYSKIYLAVRRHTRQIQTLQVQQQTQNSDAMTACCEAKKVCSRNFLRLCHVSGLLSPMNFLYIATLTTDLEKNLSNCLLLYAWTLAWLNSFINPLVYFWKMKQIRHAMTNILWNIITGNN